MAQVDVDCAQLKRAQDRVGAAACRMPRNIIRLQLDSPHNHGASLILLQVPAVYESILGVQYALSKLDLVGIPDFAAGAMENWGIVTFREVDLLVPPESAAGASGHVATSGASVAQLYRVPTVVAHELAHMWFGMLLMRFLSNICSSAKRSYLV